MAGRARHVVVGLLVLGAVAVGVGRLGDDGPSHPDEWDPRVADLAAFVEDERGLEFEHPVYVDFLTPAEYTAQTTDDEGTMEEDEREQLDRYAAELRALGVASGELDLFAAFNQVSDGGTLAFYDPTDERVRVRGTEMTVGLEVTLVHELTHALQDQHFDLERLDGPQLDDGAATAFRGLAEGDALRVEEAYTVRGAHRRGAGRLRRGVRGGARRQRGGDGRRPGLRERASSAPRTPSDSRS